MNEYEVEVCVDKDRFFFCRITEIATGYPEHVTPKRATETQARADADQWRKARLAEFPVAV
jgi:hypothetical protein